MAYYNSDFYDGDTGEYHWTPYSANYDVAPCQDSSTYSAYEFSEPKLIDYYPTTYGNAYDSSEIEYSTYNYNVPKLIDYSPTTYNDSCDPYATNSEINYSKYNFSEPNVIEYDPNPYGSGYLSSGTQYFISYSTSEFNDLDFVEYDPTPYDGGYNQTLTYGKPLPPSDKTCYPRSSPELDGLSFDGFSYNSIPSPYGNDDIDDSSAKPINESKPTAVSEGKQSNGDKEGTLVEPLDGNHGEEREGYNSGHDYPWSGYDYGYGNGKIGEHDYECNKQVMAQTQHGYGSNGMDFCESIFGYWPCLSSKNKKRNGHQEEGDEGSNSDPWKGTAEYIFASPFGYGERSGGGSYYGPSGNGCESYYQQQPCYGQEVYYEKYDENSCSHKFNVF